MNEVTKNLNLAINILNHINVCGKQNLLNLGGVIDLLENTINNINNQENKEIS